MIYRLPTEAGGNTHAMLACKGFQGWMMAKVSRE